MNTKLHLMLAVYALLVSGSFHVGHAITKDIDPVVLTFARFALGAAIFWVIAHFRYGVKMPGLRELSGYTLISLSLVGYFVAMFYALRYTTAVNTSMVYTLTPLFTAFFGAVILRERQTWPRIMMLCVTLIGCVWVISGGDVGVLMSLKFNRGDMLFLAGCVGMGLYPVLSKLFARGVPTPVLTFWTLLTGSIVLLLIANVDVVRTDWLALPLRVYLGLGYITVFTTAVTFFILQYVSMRMPVAKVMAYIYVIPVFSMLWSWLLGGSAVSMSMLAGAVTAICGMVFFLRSE